MKTAKIGFIGFGEVAAIFSQSMRENGAQIWVYDKLMETEEGGEIIFNRIQADGINIASLEELIANTHTVLSTVTTQASKGVAEECSSLLQPGQMFIDLNSTSPLAKVELCGIVQSSGADFVEGVILGAVGATGIDTKILTAGKKGEEAAKTLTQLGLNVSFYSDEIGKASMFKMLRGIFSKGMEALILEVLITGKRACIDKDLWNDIIDFMRETPFDHIASNWVQSHAVAYERRYWEVTQIVETMQEVGIEPIMAAATESLFARSRSLGLSEAFPNKPATYEEVIEFMNQKLKKFPPTLKN